MTDLIDLTPIKATVSFDGGTVAIGALSLRATSQLIIAHPELVQVLTGKSADLAKVVTDAPEAALKIVAFAVADQEQGEAFLKAFDSAPVGKQIDLIAKIGELSFGESSALPFILGLASRLMSEKSSTPPAPSAGSDPAPETSAATSQSSSDT